MYLLGIDVGSSSVKVSVLDANSGKVVGSASSPKTEMKIDAPQSGFAEQNPTDWWFHFKNALEEIKNSKNIDLKSIKAIGISYQMHGLVCIDKDKNVLRPSIIWCDSRAVKYGEKAFTELGETFCLENFLNSPGNFTASKLKWVQENEHNIYNKIYKIMLPGDYIAMKLTGEIQTTISGLSEGIMWNFKKNDIATDLLNFYKIDTSFLATLTETFSSQAQILPEIATELGLSKSTVVSYRAGDQPNNAFSLNVLNEGEVAATAGTSGVVYGINTLPNYDPKSRVNPFVHVNHKKNNPKYGVLLCVNGTGILNSWLKNSIFQNQFDYIKMNELASKIKIGSENLKIYPFGNGAERILENKDLGSSIKNINFNIHSAGHMARAAQEGIAFGLAYGMEIMKEMGIKTNLIRAGEANMFLSNVFRETFANTTGATIELYNTDGAQGAARGSGIGAGIYKNFNDAFVGFSKIKTIEPDKSSQNEYLAAFEEWKKGL